MPRRKKKAVRERKPFFHERLQCWYFWQFKAGKRVMTRLDKDRQTAHDLWHKLRSQETAEDRAVADPGGPSVQRVIAKFLTWLDQQPKKAQRTRDWYRGWLVGTWEQKDGSRGKVDLENPAGWVPAKSNKAFGAYIGSKLKMVDLSIGDIEGWLGGKLANASENGRNGALRSVRRLILWALRRGLIAKNPMEGIEWPDVKPRDVRVSDSDWQALLENARPELKEFLIVLRATGMRPFELRQVEARHLHGRTIVFDVEESKGKKRRRSLPLNKEAFEILSRLADERTVGPLLRNRKGNPWRGDTAANQLLTLREKIWGEGAKPELTLYAIRHEFVSSAIERGTDTVSLIKICGWRDGTMLSRVYSHLQPDSDHMQRQIAIATGEAS